MVAGFDLAPSGTPSKPPVYYIAESILPTSCLYEDFTASAKTIRDAGRAHVAAGQAKSIEGVAKTRVVVQVWTAQKDTGMAQFGRI